jgi:hypothetical protein
VLTFTALPGGYRNNNNGNFNNLGNNSNFWSATENNATNAWNRKLNYNNSNVNRNNNNKSYGFSVRCLRDLTENERPSRVASATLKRLFKHKHNVAIKFIS